MFELRFRGIIIDTLIGVLEFMYEIGTAIQFDLWSLSIDISRVRLHQCTANIQLLYS